MSLDLRRIRGFLQLNLKDVELGAGVPAARLSKAERGSLQLNEAEQRALKNYYLARWKMAATERESLLLQR